MKLRLVAVAVLAALISTGGLAQERTLNILAHAVHKRVAHGEGDAAAGGDIAGEWAANNNVTLNWITLNVDPIHERLLRELALNETSIDLAFVVNSRFTPLLLEGLEPLTGSYDPTSNTLYWGTANPVPMYDPEYRPGDNLYSNSSLALDADTGELKWHFQYTPGDYMDYDEVGIQLLVDTEVNGEPRKVLAHFGRNGLFYTLDRTNGSFINAQPYVEQLTWTKGIDPKTGLPVEYDPAKSLQEYAQGVIRRDGTTASTCPHIQGGINFWPTAYDPTTGIAYGAGIEGCSDLETVTVAPADVTPGQLFLGGGATDSGEQLGSIFGIDVATGEQIGKTMRPYPNYAGVLLTPGLVWTGELDGTFGAYDAKTLEQRWSINVGAGFKAPPISFAVDGKQYIAIAGGAGIGTTFGHPELSTQQAYQTLFVFAL